MITQEHEDATYGAGYPLIMQVTGASKATACRWKKQPDSIPEAAKRLIRFAVWGDLAEVFGKEWENFKIVKGKLYPPLFRGGFTPVEIGAMFFKVQEVGALRRDVIQLRLELEAEKERSEQALVDERERSAQALAAETLRYEKLLAAEKERSEKLKALLTMPSRQYIY